MKPNTGSLAEDLADTWLKKRKLKIVTRNFHSRWGEIDIIALDKSMLCFIEIRYRKSNAYGSAAESVTFSKQQRIIKTAQAFLNSNPCHADKPARFDVIGISGELNSPEFDWHKNAFMMSA